MNQTQIRHLLAAGWGLYAGVVAGYFISKRHHQKIADAEIESVKEVYARRQEVVFKQVTEKASPPTKAVDLHLEMYDRIADEYDSEGPGVVDPRLSPDALLAQESMEVAETADMDDAVYVDPEDLESNVEFETLRDGLGNEIRTDEIPRRFPPTTEVSSINPYVISVDEFMDDEPKYDKITLTYYDGDDVLADDNDRVIRSLDKIIGDEAITKFGERSGDDHIVYVRNESMQTDYEVTLEERSYQEVVLKIKAPRINNGGRFKEDDDT